jgi:hypothetical protein
MLWCNSVRLWKGDNKTRLFPFDFNAKREERVVVSGVDYRLSKKLSGGGCVEISNGSYKVNMNESSQDGILKYPMDDLTPPLLDKEELILYIHMRFKEE